MIAATETTDRLADRLAAWDGLAVVSRFDRATGAWIFIAMHDATLGPPTGGTRFKTYPSPADALHDALRLAEGMTSKWAVVDIPFGGGKAVIAPPGPLAEADRRALLHRYGVLVEGLRGAFVTGEDLGTTVEDMTVVAGATRHVLGGHGGGGVLADPGPFTALGVAAAMASVLDRLEGNGAVAGRRIAIQGVGDVGAPLARLLRTAGAELVLADLDEGRARSLAAELGAEVVPTAEIASVPCDVFAPCAVGAVLDGASIPRLGCRAVCGSANNQLAEEGDADRLHRRGILYAPDYVANAGGAIAFAHLTRDREAGRHALEHSVAAIGPILDAILGEAAERNESPLHAARRRVERTLAAARAERV